MCNSLNKYFTKWVLHWISTSLNEYFTEWLLHWMSPSLNEFFFEWVLHQMSTSLNDYFIEWVFLWMSTSLNEYLPRTFPVRLWLCNMQHSETKTFKTTRRSRPVKFFFSINSTFYLYSRPWSIGKIDITWLEIQIIIRNSAI